MKDFSFLDIINNIKDGEEFRQGSFIIRKEEDKLYIINSATDCMFRIWDNDKFEKVVKPVTFEEVLKSDKCCRLEHPKLYEILKQTIKASNFSSGIFSDFDIKNIKSYLENKNKFFTLSILFGSVMSYCSSEEYKEIIQDGEWFLEN